MVDTKLAAAGIEELKEIFTKLIMFLLLLAGGVVGLIVILVVLKAFAEFIVSLVGLL